MPRRDRVRRRSPAAKWAGRVLGVLGTAAVLGVGAVAASMVVSRDDDAALTAAPVATPEGTKPAGKGTSRLTLRQRQERRRAVEAVRRQGYRPVRLADYKVDHLLRVLTAEPVGTTPPGMRAFFFADGEYVGRDATSPSGKLRAGRQLEREITIVYTLYEDGDRPCCPKGGDTRVHFRWTGEALTRREALPPATERLPPA